MKLSTIKPGRILRRGSRAKRIGSGNRFIGASKFFGGKGTLGTRLRGALGRVNIAKVSAYEDDKSQNEWTLFAAHKLQHKAFTNTLSLRQSIIDSKSAPLAISNGSQYKLSDKLNWRFPPIPSIAYQA